MDSNWYRDTFDRVGDYWSDVKEFTLQGYVDAILHLDKLVYNCYGFSENGQFYNGTHLVNSLSAIKNKIEDENQGRIRFSYKKPKGDRLVNVKVQLAYQKHLWWYSDLGSAYLADFSHCVDFRVTYHEGHDSIITVTVHENCYYNSHPNGELKQNDVDMSEKVTLYEVKETKSFQKWNDLLSYLESQCITFTNLYKNQVE
jgi:hypothetical protein